MNDGLSYITSTPGNKKKRFIIMIVLISFLLILFLFLYTAFQTDVVFTGNTIKEMGSNESISIDASLGIPEIKLDGNFEKLRLEGQSSAGFYAGDQKFELGPDYFYIVLDNFDGDVSFNSDEIIELDGKVEKASINGVPILSKSGRRIKIEFEESFSYTSLFIDSVFIKELCYTTSGSILLGNKKTIISVDDEETCLGDFQGVLDITDEKFNIDGYLKELNIKGKSDLSVSYN